MYMLVCLCYIQACTPCFATSFLISNDAQQSNNLFCAGGHHHCCGRASERNWSWRIFTRLLLMIRQTTSLRDSRGLCSVRSSEKSQCTSHYILTGNSSAGAQDCTELWQNRWEADCSHTAIIYSFTLSFSAYPTGGHGGAGAYQSRAGPS